MSKQKLRKPLPVDTYSQAWVKDLWKEYSVANTYLKASRGDYAYNGEPRFRGGKRLA